MLEQTKKVYQIFNDEQIERINLIIDQLKKER